MNFVRRRRAAIIVGVIMGLVAGSVIGTLITRDNDVIAEEQRMIPVRARIVSTASGIEAGDACSAPLGFPAFGLTPQQIVVRNEANTVIAIADLDGGEWARNNVIDGLECVIEQEIPVPDAEFYTVYLGDDRIVGYSASDFPVFPLDGINLDFSS